MCARQIQYKSVKYASHKSVKMPPTAFPGFCSGNSVAWLAGWLGRPPGRSASCMHNTWFAILRLAAVKHHITPVLRYSGLVYQPICCHLTCMPSTEHSTRTKTSKCTFPSPRIAFCCQSVRNIFTPHTHLMCLCVLVKRVKECKEQNYMAPSRLHGPKTPSIYINVTNVTSDHNPYVSGMFQRKNSHILASLVSQDWNSKSTL